ncbi:MAG: hypothetical protein ACTSYC_02045 [Promethearchaeota archaeon]
MVLFQKAKIKKRIMERTEERSKQIKSSFINTYNEFCNNSLSSNLIKTNNQALNLKNRLIKELNQELLSKIKERIQEHYSDYIRYLIRTIEKDEKELINKAKVEIIFISRDHAYFMKNKNDFPQIFKSNVEIRKPEEDFIGGYKIRLPLEKISLDHTIDEIIKSNQPIIEKEFTIVISDKEIKDIQREFEQFIHEQKLKIEDYLIEYDEI